MNKKSEKKLNLSKIKIAGLSKPSQKNIQGGKARETVYPDCQVSYA